MMLEVHVDDMVVAGSVVECDGLHKHLHKRFSRSNLGHLTLYNGCTSRHHRNKSFTVLQAAYIGY